MYGTAGTGTGECRDGGGMSESLLGTAGSEGACEGGEGHKNNLGVFNGVFVPCLLNILGIILFLKIGWAVGYAGWATVLGMFVVGESLAIMTVLSMAAIVSNGTMKGGGSYFLISRSLGAEFGGSVGLLFYSAYAVGTSFYVVGFATEIVQAFFPDVAQDDDLKSQKKLYTIIIGSIALAFVMFISYLGAGFFTRINGFVFAVQFGAVLVGILSMYFGAAKGQLDGGGWYDGWSYENLKNNIWSDYSPYSISDTGTYSVRIVFGILFPAMTGIMEGANLSGDLKNPNRDIGRGTLAAVFAAITTYVFLIFGNAGAFDRTTLKKNQNVMVDVSWPSKYIVIVGISVSSFSSALGSVFGGARVLQALGRDDLPPSFGLSVFSKGSANGDEPRRAVLFTWLIAQCACLIGDLDKIAPIISSFFLLSYGTVNLTCFLLDVSGTPNFRPHFRFYSRAQSLIGFIMCITILFYLDVWYSITACAILITLFFYISYKAPAKTWGDVSQSIMYHQVRKYLLRLDLESHPKNWRPSLLLLVGPGVTNMHLIEFCNSLKKGGLYILGDAVVGGLNSIGSNIPHVRKNWLKIVKDLSIKAIPEVTFAPTLREGFQQLVLLAGLGGMKPNCITMQLPQVFGKSVEPECEERRHTKMLRMQSENHGTFDNEEIPVFENPTEFMDVVRDIVITFKRNLLLACNFSAPQLQHYSNFGSNSTVDIWVFGNDLNLVGSLSLEIQLAHIFKVSRRSKIRILNIVNELCDIEEQEQALEELGAKTRLHMCSYHAIAMQGIMPLDKLIQANATPLLEEVNRIVLSNSQSKTCVTFMELPRLPTDRKQDRQFVHCLDTIIRGYHL
uniref:Amino acid permease/ SLC12A domain-containing protein n=1 Tax=Mucochytrium quahogii TaxID=96639 RepID=A0A7S2W762_9STRA|mmetsp:Transcript_15760/g.34057  ORF Transcript_15760/g.34057 Transcript_15760/m.34057 type:complete len:844 (+) Transcript_15760:79-2610(+)